MVGYGSRLSNFDTWFAMYEMCPLFSGFVSPEAWFLTEKKSKIKNKINLPLQNN